MIKRNTSQRNSNSHIFFLLIIGVLILILMSLEILLYKICKLILYFGFLALLFAIFLNYLLMRKIILSIAFPDSSKLIHLHTQYSFGGKQAEIILDNLVDLYKSIELFTNNTEEKDISILINIRKTIRNSMDYINYFIDIFRKMKNKFNNLNKIQNQFYLTLLMLKEDIIQSKLIEYLSNEISKSKSNNLITEEEIQMDTSNQIFTKILTKITTLEDILHEYLGHNKKCIQLSYCRNMFSFILLGTIEQFHVELSHYFNFEEKTLITSDHNKIEYIIIHPEEERNIENIKKNAIIICGPNGSAFQLFSKNIHLDSYIRKGLDIICWNYRGYGFSSGTPSYNNLRSDIIELYNEIKKLNKYNKIGVHGISIGGIPACYLSCEKSDIQLLISDRNFGQIEYIIRTLTIGSFLFYFYKIFFFQKTKTILDYLNSKCYKIVLNDPFDTIVKECGSLKTLTSEEIINSFLFKNNNNSPSPINNNENIPLRHNISNRENVKVRKCALDFLLNNKEDKNNFIQCLLNISNEVNLNKEELNKNNKDLADEIIVDEVEKSRIQIIKKIKDIFIHFSSAGDYLSTLFNIKKDWRKIIFINNFFNNLIIWGTKNYDENDNSVHYFTTENLNWIFSDLKKNLENFLNQEDIKKCSHMKIFSYVEKFTNYISIFEQNFDLLYIKRNDNFFNSQNLFTNNSFINNSSSSGNQVINNDQNTLSEINPNKNNYENTLIKIGRGNLLNLQCGHNGGLNFEELETLMKHMNLSGIFDNPEN